MFYNVIYPFADQFTFLNVFQYLTVRSGAALATSFFLSLVFFPWAIRKLRVLQAGQKTVRDDHPEGTTSSKQGTPSMGGLMIVATLLISTLFWTDLSNPYVWLLVSTVLGFATIGFVDDILSLRGHKKGIPGKLRLLLETIIVGAVAYAVTYIGAENATSLYVPFFKDVVFEMSLFGFIFFSVLVVVGSANAVNLTDGLDGLVSVPAAVTAASFALVAYIVGRVDFTDYLHIPYVAGAGEVAVFCSALTGSMLGFLWYNAPPARIFMGDTGSLAIGASLGTSAIILKQEFLLAIIGGLFVLETVSVIVQVVSFKLTGKRVFRMAPIHHHFEHKGWPESTIVVRFWIISIILALVGLATLKIR
ncbi:MAG: phospho-N-acetylmuramoyl-pentapeptide-transferase [Alphaproteobacteria bacterium]|jgi:phospho-N-acetylmuramoyl-pentapeptide-transferase